MFCHSFMYINNYKVSKLLSSSFTCSCHQLLVMLVHPTLLSYIQNMHCSHIFKSRERFAINDFFLNHSTNIIHNTFSLFTKEQQLLNYTY